MSTKIPTALDDVTFAQGGGDRPHVQLAAMPAGEYGIGVAQFRFAGGASVKGFTSHHLLMINLGSPARISCQVNNNVLDHISPTGNITVCPADAEFSGESSDSLSTLLFTIPRELLDCVSAERAKPKAPLLEKLAGCDRSLLGVACDLADEAASGFLSGPRYWTELVDTLLCLLFEDYLHDEPSSQRGVLPPEILVRINTYLAEHLGEPIDVDTIADLAARGRSHFPRIFRRSVGMSPHQYLVRFRLKHAFRMLSQGETRLGEVAAATGFVDQSHLCHWVKRVYGTSPAQLVAADRRL